MPKNPDTILGAIQTIVYQLIMTGTVPDTIKAFAVPGHIVIICKGELGFTAGTALGTLCGQFFNATQIMPIVEELKLRKDGERRVLETVKAVFILGCIHELGAEHEDDIEAMRSGSDDLPDEFIDYLLRKKAQQRQNLN